MITAVHTLIYSDQPDETRAFLRDVVGWPYLESEPGWLIFKTGPSELGVHPTSGGSGEQSWSTPQQHQISLVCDDLEATVAELRTKGAEFTNDIRDDGFGLTIMLKVPGAQDIMVYQPKYPPAWEL